MIKRFAQLSELKNHPIEKKLFAKLTKVDESYIDLFIFQHRDLSANECAEKVNRLFLEEKNRPKNHSQIWAILTNLK